MKTKMPATPQRLKRENRDIERYIVFRYIKKAVLTALWYAVSALIVLSVLKFSEEPSAMVIAIMFSVIFAVLPYFMIWRNILSEKSAVGVLVRKGFREEQEMQRGLAWNAGDLRKEPKDVVYFFIETADGEKIKKRYYENGNIRYLFFDGDTVCIRRGLKYPQNLTKVREGLYMCVVCGNCVEDTKDFCPRCGHSIIKLEGHIPTPEEDYEYEEEFVTEYEE